MQRDRNPRWRRIKSSPFHRIGDAYGSFFDGEHFLGRNAFDDSWIAPKIPANIKKTSKTYEIEMALPGFVKKEITILVEGDLLKVLAEKDMKGEVNDSENLDYDILGRSFQLEPDIDRDRISSKFKDGLLKIYLPYNGEVKKKPRVKVKVT
ncbi:hypothetical protein BFP97_05595 [Roseivirga sp. 4D4]|uniref:Hsp20/alpha crystallin family protein n=1 Tax=Roseivirga sp. 4D4 TaxID=1889784 RepID=UPI000853A982|nr:Hsp20/alpha crystallin family protein [Roseivirga sp. 4D4]OEK01015.1 hypothetical protein BFP97_05595 [Roseivirga sp. 4D4]